MCSPATAPEGWTWSSTSSDGSSPSHGALITIPRSPVTGFSIESPGEYGSVGGRQDLGMAHAAIVGQNPRAGPLDWRAVKARVLIRPKEGILDPQGKAVERALPALGFEGIEHVRVGRMVELEAEDPERLSELCSKLLANPLIEDFEIESIDGD